MLTLKDFCDFILFFSYVFIMFSHLYIHFTYKPNKNKIT